MSDEPEVRFKDFTLNRPPIKFRIAKENFDAVNALSVDLMQNLVNVATQFDGSSLTVANMGAAIDNLIVMFNELLEEESAIRFAKIARKLDVQEQIIPLLYWLMEAYGLRPTEVSSDS